jgi:hypothetical protein
MSNVNQVTDLKLITTKIDVPRDFTIIPVMYA